MKTPDMAVRHRRLKLLLLPLLMLAVATVAPANAAGDAAAAPGFQPFTLAPYFSCEIPKNWGTDDGHHGFGLSPEEKKVFGITLQAPDMGVLPVRISVFFYAKGNLLHDSPEVYIRRHAQPIFAVKEGDDYGPVTVAVVGKQKAWVFERQKNEFVPYSPLDGVDPLPDDPRVYERRSMMVRPAPLRERFVVIPAESGFYVLRYSAPAKRFAKYRPDFERVTVSFHPQQ